MEAQPSAPITLACGASSRVRYSGTVTLSWAARSVEELGEHGGADFLSAVSGCGPWGMQGQPVKHLAVPKAAVARFQDPVVLVREPHQPRRHAQDLSVL